MTNKNLTKALVLALALTATTGLAASGNGYNSGTNTITMFQNSDPTISFSATVDVEGFGTTSIKWECIQSWNPTLSATVGIYVGGNIVGVGGGGGNANVTAAISWSGQSIPVDFATHNRTTGKPFRWEFKITDSNFLNNYSPTDALELSVETQTGGNSILPALPDNNTADWITVPGSTPVSFSGLIVSDSDNKTSTSGCVQVQSGGNQIPQNQGPVAPVVKYEGPEFSALSLKPLVHGSGTVLSGQRLNQVRSIEIGGKAATFKTISDTEMSLTPAAGLKPGTYDLVIQSSAGKLTHLNAIRVRPALKAISITTASFGRVSEARFLEHSLIASMQQSELNKARCIVNGPNLAQARAQAERLCALIEKSNPNIQTTVVEPRSTLKSNTVYARVIYGWN